MVWHSMLHAIGEWTERIFGGTYIVQREGRSGSVERNTRSWSLAQQA